MFITCQECNTTYRLDERVLKPTGSKVKCSQCGHKFVAVPVAVGAVSAPIQEPLTHAIPSPQKAGPAVTIPAVEEAPLAGIDLAELDALMQGDDNVAMQPEKAAPVDDIDTGLPLDEQTSDLGEIDFDMDLDAAIQSVEADAEEEGEDQEGLEDIELDMDFELDDAPAAEDELEDLDLGPAIEDAEAVINSADGGDTAEPTLADDLESVFDGLELDVDAPVDGAKASPAEETAADDLGLADLDLDIEDEAPAAEDAGEEPELSLDEDLELGLEEPEPVEAPSAERGQDTAADELALDFDLDLEDESIQAEPEGEDVELSLDDDFDLELDEAPAKGGAEPKEAVAGEDDLDLTGLDTLLGTTEEIEGADTDLGLDEELDFELEDGPDGGAADRKGAAADEDDLDLTGLDTLLGTGEELDDADADLSLDDGLGLEEELEFSLDETPSKGAADGTAALDDELDLTGLDTLMDSGEEEGAAVTAESDEPELVLDELDLELDKETPRAAAASDSGPSDGEPEDLELELDAGFEEKSAVEEISMEEEEEIDLSDIEQMLGGDGKPVKPKAPAAKAPASAPDLGGAAEIDLTEIESAIDEAELSDIDEPEVHEEPELELDMHFDNTEGEEGATVDELSLELESEDKADEAEESLELELELESAADAKSNDDDTMDLDGGELDLSDLGDIVEETGAEEKRETVISSGDIELEFQIEEDEASAPSTTLSRTTAGVMKTPAPSTDASLDETMETLAVEESYPPQPKPFKARKKSSKSLVFLIFLLLLAAIGGALWYAVTQMGMEIPYVSDYLNPKPKDPSGTMRLSTLDINSNFLENSQAGRLFVITGKVRNGYNTARSDIRLRGRLYTKGKKVAKTEFSYAGVVLSDQELATLTVAEIKQRLNAAPQSQQPHGFVRPGQNIAFMVVFSDLPPMEELDEFAVESVGSKEGR